VDESYGRGVLHYVRIRVMTKATSPSTASIKARRIVLGITGGVAAYKSAELTRALKKSGIDVQVAMTDAATKFITAATLQALSGQRVFTDLWDASMPNGMAHIELSRDADAILVAPASADFIAKLANGLCNDLLSTLCIARNAHVCPLMLAPAMNREMWENPATRRNVARLIADGVIILGPDSGDQACGETGMGRMLEPAAIFTAVEAFFAAQNTPKNLAGVTALVTAGPTFEAIDPVRGITNSSSGKMGYAIAEALRNAGAIVTLISGPTSLTAPNGIEIVNIKSASEMLDAVTHKIDDVKLFFAVAAVADYTPIAPNPQKMKKSGQSLTIELKPTVDILATVASLPTPPFCVGFAAESENVVEYARKKRENKHIPVIVANLATEAINANDNQVTLIDDAGEHPLAKAAKTQIAAQIVSHVAGLYLKQPPPNATGGNIKSNVKPINSPRTQNA
jgi:phosphopantothenoylcysteine decarboxylase / phosphopantothenate---cysteine ligase